MTLATKIRADDLFRFRWESGMPTMEMADLYRVSDVTIRLTARLADLPPRKKGKPVGWKKPEHEPTEPVAQTPPKPPKPAPEPQPVFGGICADLVTELRATRGVYRELARVGAAHGLTTKQAQQRYFQVRGRV